MTINKVDFKLGTLDDELRVDELCKELLMEFYNRMLADGIPPDLASRLAGSADYFIRDFVISIKGRNIFCETPGLVRQFAGNWYVVSNLEPKGEELAGHLEGIRAFYRYLNSRELISAEFMELIEAECDDLGYYSGRIDSFWAIVDDGYLSWERECSLKEP
jgi:hypothetical protein